jgi:predicted DNA-binding transcriptional regulator AlpA
MTNIVQLDYNELQTAIKLCLKDALDEIKSIPLAKPLPDKIFLDEAVEQTGLSKPQFYKMTMLGEVPHGKYGKRLVFSRKELTSWMELRTIRKQSPEETATKHLQKEAAKRLR